jgi:hypothetical protein
MRVGALPTAKWVLMGLLAVVVAVALVALQVQGQRLNGGGSSSQSQACSPQPCLDLENYTIWVSHVTQSGGVVRMQVVFQNSSGSTHATPEDLQLIDASGHAWPGIQNAPGCTSWGRTEFNNGAKFGPITLCFRPTSTQPPLTLHWTPDMGLFCCDGSLRVE